MSKHVFSFCARKYMFGHDVLSGRFVPSTKNQLRVNMFTILAASVPYKRHGQKTCTYETALYSLHVAEIILCEWY